MINKELIDFCNDFWYIKGRCENCPYSHTYCEAFHKKYRITPYKEDTLDNGMFYADEEIEL